MTLEPGSTPVSDTDEQGVALSLGDDDPMTQAALRRPLPPTPRDAAAAELEARSAAPSLNPLRLLAAAWTGASPQSAIADEAALLRHFVRAPYVVGRVRVALPQLGLGDQHINTIDINPDARGAAPPIVWVHGAGSGLGFGFRNYDALASLGGGAPRRVLGVDWLGAAGSSRPPYPYGGALRRPAWTLPAASQVDAAIAFSVDALEAWRAALGIEQFDLVAHSLGGYLATHYAMRHPRRVRRLVLVSPVGWTPKPEGARAAGGLVGALWDTGFANFGTLGLLGPCAEGKAKCAIANRLNLRDATERALVSNYFWSSVTADRASAEIAVNYLLEPHYGAVADGLYAFYAKRAVADEPAEMLANLPPTTLLYGDCDYDYLPTTPEAVKRVAAAASSPVKMHFVTDSDHHLYIDNPPEFHSRVARALR